MSADGTTVVTAEAVAASQGALRWQYLGSEILKRPTRDVTAADLLYIEGVLLPRMHTLHKRAWTPGVGLSAPQVGSDLRVTIAKVGTVGPAGGKLPGKWLTMLNPRITDRSDEMMTHTQEGCLSVPDFRTSKRRHVWVTVAWHEPDTFAVQREQKFTGFDALLMQHEADHLDGILVTDGVSRQQRRAAERAVAAWRGRQR